MIKEQKNKNITTISTGKITSLKIKIEKTIKRFKKQIKGSQLYIRYKKNRIITKQKASAVLKEFKSVLDGLGIIFYLDGGTLLGAVRDKDFCEDDQDDIDLTTSIEYWDKVEDLIELAKRKGFSLYHKWDGRDYLEKTGKRTSCQVAFIKDGGKIDLMFKDVKGDYQWYTLFKGWEVVYQKIPLELVDKLDSCIFYGTEYKIPGRVDKYLKYRYGNYHKRVHRFSWNCYTSDRSIVKSYEDI